jgi:hypothetical protein
VHGILNIIGRKKKNNPRKDSCLGAGSYIKGMGCI